MCHVHILAQGPWDVQAFAALCLAPKGHFCWKQCKQYIPGNLPANRFILILGPCLTLRFSVAAHVCVCLQKPEIQGVDLPAGLTALNPRGPQNFPGQKYALVLLGPSSQEASANGFASPTGFTPAPSSCNSFRFRRLLRHLQVLCRSSLPFSLA